MVQWALVFQKDAEKDLVRVGKTVRVRVIERLEWLVENFDSVNHLPLIERYAGFFKLRIGDWRVIYKIDWKKNIITVCYIDHRSRVYK
ncbi:MAG: type II toxin-antitoxin system RelE/ParE family toxin [Candidatus Azambacteria bacterium]|nr:type II toxin-antitoxin system RelE/ParE family toxin [Candidatus Azambacteria bacterium]